MHRNTEIAIICNLFSEPAINPIHTGECIFTVLLKMKIHLRTNLSNDHRIRTLLKDNYNILRAVCLKTEMIIFETLYSFKK